MLDLLLRRPSGRPLLVLAAGAHPDDIEIGAGGTLAALARAVPTVEVHVLVLSGSDERAQEARSSAASLLGVTLASYRQADLPDGRFPGSWSQVKDTVEAVAADISPDLVIGPRRADAHQDHQVLAHVLPTVFRSSLVLGYEIPKRDGETERGTVHVPLELADVERKWEHLAKHFPSQASRTWMDREVFVGLARLRGLECGHRYAESFTCSSAVLRIE